MALNLKNDDSFLRKLVVGAEGTNETMRRLEEMGFHPIELERGSTGYKIWKKIKIKRVRVPDILCLKTGLRFESRGKTKPEISMSHSPKKKDRAWDYDMRDDDWISITVFQQNPDSPIDVKRDSPVHFVRVKDLRKAVKKKQVEESKPKGVEEGSEIRYIWTSAVANAPSTVECVDQSKIILRSTETGKTQRIVLQRKKGGNSFVLKSQVKQGDSVDANQIIASVVPVLLELPSSTACRKHNFLNELESQSLSGQYAAAKALRHVGYSVKEKTALKRRVEDDRNNIYVRLESAAALAKHGHQEGWSFIESNLLVSNLAVTPETQLETIIVLSELDGTKSEKLLTDILCDENRDEELRAGAAWGLGRFATKESAIALVDTFNLCLPSVRVEAARSLLQIAKKQVPVLLDLLKKVSKDKRDGISWVLSRVGGFDPATVLHSGDDNLRIWMSCILGHGKSHFSEESLKTICQSDPHIYFAASVLWQILDSWTNNLNEY